jgi:hypothetical protein
VSWTASGDNVGVTGYKIFRNGVQIGVTATTACVDTGLAPNTTYSYAVSAYDAAGNESPQSSPPAVATTMEAMTIAAAKMTPDASPVGFLSKIVTAVFHNYFYVEEPDRSAGIRVVPLEMPNGLAVGKTVDVGGIVESSNGERFVGAANVVVSQY